MKNHLITLLILAATLLLGSCADESTAIVEHRPPVAIAHADECHLCGMMINEFAGPKGQIFNKGKTTAQKFCSTRDLFSHLLQPENTRQVSHVWVHDMSHVNWDKTM